MANLDSEENKEEFLKVYGLEENGLKKIISASRGLLGLQTFYTCSHVGMVVDRPLFYSTLYRGTSMDYTNFDNS